jgi:hypothetical protein
LPLQPKFADRQQEGDPDEDVSCHWHLPVRPTQRINRSIVTLERQGGEV